MMPPQYNAPSVPIYSVPEHQTHPTRRGSLPQLQNSRMPPVKLVQVRKKPSGQDAMLASRIVRGGAMPSALVQLLKRRPDLWADPKTFESYPSAVFEHYSSDRTTLSQRDVEHIANDLVDRIVTKVREEVHRQNRGLSASDVIDAADRDLKYLLPAKSLGESKTLVARKLMRELSMHKKSKNAITQAQFIANYKKIAEPFLQTKPPRTMSCTIM